MDTNNNIKIQAIGIHFGVFELPIDANKQVYNRIYLNYRVQAVVKPDSGCYSASFLLSSRSKSQLERMRIKNYKSNNIQRQNKTN